MKIKKIIAILLTLIMVTAMLPTAFAEAETSPVNYIFKEASKGGPTGVGQTVSVPSDGSSALTEYTEHRNWAYLGYVGNKASDSVYLKATDHLNGSNAKGQWIALKIKAPESGTYSISMSAYLYHRNTNNMEIYLVPMNAVLDAENDKTATEVFAYTNTEIYGTVSGGVCSDYASFADGKLGTYDISEYLVGKANIWVAEGDSLDGVVSECTLTDAQNIRVTEGITDYVLLFVSNGTGNYHNLRPASLTLTPVLSSETYIFKNTANGGPSGISTTLSALDGSSGFTDYADGRDWAYLGYTGNGANGSAYMKISNCLEGINLKGQWIAMKIKAPEPGTYSVSASAYMYARNTNNMEIYLVPMNAVLDAENDKTAAEVFAYTNTEIYGTVSGGICSDYASFADGKLGTYDISEYLVGKTNIRSSTAGNAECVMTDAQTIKVTEDITDYVLLFVSNGTGNYNNLRPATLTLTETKEVVVEPEDTPEDAPEYIALATSTSIAPNTINVIGNAYTRGQSVTVTAEEIQGYTFRHWVRGTADKGEVVSKSASYSFRLMTNTYLTAVYSEKTDDKTVEFYNGNGDYLETKTVVNNAVELPETPALTGFKFLRWIVGKNGNESVALDKENVTADVTYAVAEFGDNETVKFTVAGESEAVLYDTPITRESSDGEEKAWYRNGALVGYGTSYTFHIWADVASIEEKELTTKAPVVYLDPVAKDSARMIEYDAGGNEIAEVGILFGDGTDMSVESCMYKATSAKSGSDLHGQFTAKPSNDSYKNAKGYLIYKDGDTYKVVYSD